MSQPAYSIPERIRAGEQQYLNCQIGESVRPTNDSDAAVLDRFEAALADSFLQIYYNYPDTGPSDNQYVDLVVLSPVTGVILVNILDLHGDEIEKIEGPDWSLTNQPESVRPVTAIRNGAVGIRRQFTDREELRDQDLNPIVPIQSFVGLPNIEKEELTDFFSEADMDSILFADHLEGRDADGEDPLLNVVGVPDDEVLADEVLRNALAALKFSGRVSGGQLNVAREPRTKRELLEFLQQRLKILTDKQLKIGMQAPDGPQQIRGIAGSGKTVVTALRAAKLHWEHPEWKIAVAFRNHGLRQTHTELISAFYEGFVENETPNWDNLHVRHDWGGSSTGPGMYYEIARAAGESPLTYPEAKSRFRTVGSTSLLANCCRDIIERTDIPEIYDAILIDEAQDLPPSFFQMCYKSATDEKRIYWAYDEAQNLATLEAKNALQLFGNDYDGNPRVDVSQKLGGGVNGTHVMRKAFRTPRSVLMTAHGFGMGLYRDGPVIQTITNRSGWDRLGYVIESGDFTESGNTVELKRPLENSPHPLMEHQSPASLLRQHWAESSWEDEIEWVVEDIRSTMVDEDVLPREIMLTDLWAGGNRSSRVDHLKKRLREVLSDLPTTEETGVYDFSEAVSERGAAAPFRKSGQITISGIHYARGNEAPVVYVVGMDTVAEQTSKELSKGREESWRRQHVLARNRAFVAFTRTQGWLIATGTDPTNRIIGEMNQVLADTKDENPRLHFNVPPEDSPFKNLEPSELTEEFQTAMNEF